MTREKSTNSRARRSPARSRQHLKTHLAEMTVGRERVCQSDLAHDREARAIGQREILVAILKEQLACSLEAVAVDAFPPDPLASIDLTPPGIGSIETKSKPDA